MYKFPVKLIFAAFFWFAIVTTVPTLVEAQSATDNRVVSLINSERQKVGLPPLNFSSKLYQASKTHNELMNQCASQYGKESCFKHQVTLLGEISLMDRIRTTGYSPTSVGEIIGWGYKTPENMVAGWMGSSGHKANILTTERKDIGCHFLDAGNGDYRKIWWTCDFGKSSITQPTATPTVLSATPKPSLTPSPKPSATPSPRPSIRPSATPTSSPTTTQTTLKPWWCAFFPTISYCL